MKKYLLYILLSVGLGLICLDHWVVNKYLQEFESHNAAVVAEADRAKESLHIASDATHRVVKLEGVIDDYKKQVVFLKDENSRALKSLETSSEQIKQIITDNAKLQTELDSNAKKAEELAEKLSDAQNKIREYEQAG